MKLFKHLLLLFLLLSPMTSAFSYNPFIAPPLLVIYIAAIFYYLRNIKHSYKGFRSIFVLVVVILLSYFVNINDETNKSTNHLIGYILIFCFLLIPFRNILILLLNKKIINLNTVLKVLSIAVFYASSFCIIEFICVNYLSININNYIPRSVVEEYEPLALGYVRARSFVEESGHFAFFLECLSPLCIWHVIYNKYKITYKIIFIITIITGLCTTLSAFGFAALAIVLSILFFPYLKYHKKQTFGILVLFFIIMLMFAQYIQPIFDLFLSIISRKTIGSDIYMQREESKGFLNLLFSESFIHTIFGFGPASYETLHLVSYKSLYVRIMMDFGLLGLLVYSFFIIKSFIFLLKIRNKILMSFLLASFITSSLHYYYIGNYYYPWYWILISFIHTFYYLQKK